MMADHDAINIPAQHGIEPDAGEIAERDVANHRCARGNVHGVPEFGFSAPRAEQRMRRRSSAGSGAFLNFTQTDAG